MQSNQNNNNISWFEDLAVLYEYPTAELLPIVSLLIQYFSSHSNTLFIPIIEKLRVFFDYCSSTSLAKLEEDYIASFEMNTKFILYIGHLLLGENYERSEFISQLQELYSLYNFEIENNELPDHISLILRFLAKKEVPQGKRKLLIDNLINSFPHESDDKDSRNETYLLAIDEKNKYPLIYFVLYDLVEVLKIWEIE